MALFLLLVQISLLILQIGSWVYAQKNNINMFEMWNGYPIWAFIPIVMLGIIINII